MVYEVITLDNVKDLDLLKYLIHVQFSSFKVKKVLLCSNYDIWKNEFSDCVELPNDEYELVNELRRNFNSFLGKFLVFQI